MASKLRISATSRDTAGTLNKMLTADLYASTEPALRLKLRWVLRYVIYATILWVIVAITIVIRNHNKSKLFQQSKYVNSCCKCWKIANNASYSGPQLEFTHCLDDNCECNICYDQYGQYLDNLFNSTVIHNYSNPLYDISCSILESNFTEKVDKYPDPVPDKGCYQYLSTSSFNLEIKKAYMSYGYLAIAICSYHIILLWLYLAIYRSINVGILFFLHSIVNAEICYYCLLKSYQFQLNHDTNCFESVIKTDSDYAIWQWVSYSIIFHVILQYVFSCSRSCFNKCQTGKKLYPLLGKFVVLITFCCMMWSLGVYIWIVYLLRNKYTDDNRLGIIIVSICILLACLGIFPFPFCREVTIQVFESWHCWCCVGCCCWQRSRQFSRMKTYAEKYGVHEEKRQILLDDNSDTEDHSDDNLL